MKEMKHKIVALNKKHPELVVGETVDVKTVDRKSGQYEVVGKGKYQARILKGIMTPVEKD